MSRIFWDTNLFIYLMEDRGAPRARVQALYQRMQARGDQLLTSTLTLGEVLVKPFEAGDALLLQEYEAALTQAAALVAFDQEAAKLYASIRRDRAIKAPDAIQLACAGAAKTDLFVTNDERLVGKTVPGIHFIASLSKAFV